MCDKCSEEGNEAYYMGFGSDETGFSYTASLKYCIYCKKLLFLDFSGQKELIDLSGFFE